MVVEATIILKLLGGLSTKAPDIADSETRTSSAASSDNTLWFLLYTQISKAGRPCIRSYSPNETPVYGTHISFSPVSGNENEMIPYASSMERQGFAAGVRLR